MEGTSVPCSFFRAVAEQATRTEKHALSARCPASDLVILDEDVDLSIFIYLSE